MVNEPRKRAARHAQREGGPNIQETAKKLPRTQPMHAPTLNAHRVERRPENRRKTQAPVHTRIGMKFKWRAVKF